MNQKPHCSGTGRTVALTRMPTSLVNCPVCGRRNLGGLNVRARHSDDEGPDEHWMVGDVPPHTAGRRTFDDIAADIDANRRGMSALSGTDERQRVALRNMADHRVDK